MRKIKWYCSSITTTNKRCSWRSHYQCDAHVGHIRIMCRPKFDYFDYKANRSKKVVGWYCMVKSINNRIITTDTRKSLEIAKKDGEKLAIELLFCCGVDVISQLNRYDLLIKVCDEVGIDI